MSVWDCFPTDPALGWAHSRHGPLLQTPGVVFAEEPQGGPSHRPQHTLHGWGRHPCWYRPLVLRLRWASTTLAYRAEKKQICHFCRCLQIGKPWSLKDSWNVLAHPCISRSSVVSDIISGEYYTPSGSGKQFLRCCMYIWDVFFSFQNVHQWQVWNWKDQLTGGASCAQGKVVPAAWGRADLHSSLWEHGHFRR